MKANDTNDDDIVGDKHVTAAINATTSGAAGQGKPGEKDKEKEKEKEKETWQQALKRMTYLIIHHVKLDLFTILLLGYALPSTKIETLK